MGCDSVRRGLVILQPYKELAYKVLATLSDGESAIIAAINSTWTDAPHQRCQAHFLSNLSESVLALDKLNHI